MKALISAAAEWAMKISSSVMSNGHWRPLVVEPHLAHFAGHAEAFRDHACLG